MLSILEQVNQFLWGFPLLALLAGAHLFFTVKLKFPQKYTLKAIRLSVTPEEGNGSGLSGKGHDHFCLLGIIPPYIVSMCPETVCK